MKKIIKKITRKIHFFLYSLTKNSYKFKHPQEKLRVIWNNARHMFIIWALEKPLVDSILSFQNYISLHRADFRITKSTSYDGLTTIYRFWWGTKLIEDMADIDCVDHYYNTRFKGRSKKLGFFKNSSSFFNKKSKHLVDIYDQYYQE